MRRGTLGAAVLASSLLLTACSGSAPGLKAGEPEGRAAGKSERQQARALAVDREAVRGVIAESVAPLVRRLGGEVVAQGGYDGCGSEADRTIALSYRVTVGVTGLDAPADELEARVGPALRRLGWRLEEPINADFNTWGARLGETTMGVRVTDGGVVLNSSGDCFEVGPDRSRELAGRDEEPLEGLPG